ncbi:hypothetical protein D9M69_569910 [compost metagenome]
MQVKVAGPAVVDQAHIATLHARRFGVHQEQANALFTVGIAAGSGRDNQQLGDVARDHRDLLAIEVPTVTTDGGGTGLHQGRVTSRFDFLVRQYRQYFAQAERLEQWCGLRVAGGDQGLGGENCHSPIWFHAEYPADFFHHQSGFDCRAVHPAKLLWHCQPQQSQVGQLLPMARVEGALVDHRGALVECAVVLHEPADAVLQHALFFVELEIHGSELQE